MIKKPPPSSIQPIHKDKKDEELSATATLENPDKLIPRSAKFENSFTIMKPEDRHLCFVRWSDEDQCYVGYCPDLYFCGTYHGD